MFIDLIFPKQCILCHKQGEYLCDECRKKLVPHPELCPICHRYSMDYRVCYNCYQHTKLKAVVVPFSYTQAIKKLILGLKYYHHKAIGQFLGNRMYMAVLCNQYLQKLLTIKKVCIAYVPSHWYRRYFVKGYNQSEVLAEVLSTLLHIPKFNIFYKTKHTKAQAKLSRQQRFSNLDNAFSISPKSQNILKSFDVVLLVDDVITTGATLSELANILYQKHPKIQVLGVVLARHNN